MIPSELFKTDTIYKTIGSDHIKGIFACGFMNKLSPASSDINICALKYSGLLVLNGTGTFLDANGNETPLYAGCFVQRLPGVLHSTIIDETSNWLEFFIDIGEEAFYALSHMGVFDSSRQILYPGVNPYIVDRLTDFHAKMKQAGNFELSPLLFQAFDILSDIYKMDKNHQIKNKEEERLIENGCRLLENSAFFHYSIHEIAKELQVGYEYFRKTFKRYAGISPGQFQINRRIDAAKKLLAEGQVPIGTIARETGYPDIFTFSKQFKKATGVSPKNFISH